MQVGLMAPQGWKREYDGWVKVVREIKLKIE